MIAHLKRAPLFALALLLAGCGSQDVPSGPYAPVAQPDDAQAQKLTTQMKQSGDVIEGAGKTIRDNTAGVRSDIGAGAPALVPVTAPKLDAIDQAAGQVMGQGVLIRALTVQVDQMQALARSIAQERDHWLAQAKQEADARAREAKESQEREAKLVKEAQEREEKIKGEFQSRLNWLLVGLAGAAFVAAMGLAGLGVLTRSGWTLGVSALCFAAGGVFVFIGLHAFWVGLGCVLVVVVAMVAGVVVVVRRNSDSTRQIGEVGQLVEVLKGKIPEEVRATIFGVGPEAGRVTDYLSGDTQNTINQLRAQGKIKKAKT